MIKQHNLVVTMKSTFQELHAIQSLVKVFIFSHLYRPCIKLWLPNCCKGCCIGNPGSPDEGGDSVTSTPLYVLEGGERDALLGDRWFSDTKPMGAWTGRDIVTGTSPAEPGDIVSLALTDIGALWDDFLALLALAVGRPVCRPPRFPEKSKLNSQTHFFCLQTETTAPLYQPWSSGNCSGLWKDSK